MVFYGRFCAAMTILIVVSGKNGPMSGDVNFSAQISLTLEPKPEDCGDVQRFGKNETGVYSIYPDGKMEFRVRCDMTTASGGWTVIQRRVSDSDFYKTWVEYQTGFGNLSESFWLGNEKIAQMTNRGWYKLRIEMTNNKHESRYAEYKIFSLGTRQDKYKLYVSGYSGTANDSLSQHSGYPFSTKDSDNDAMSSNCASSYVGAWWYTTCHYSNLNGDYGNTEYGKGIIWSSWGGYYDSLPSVTMLIKRWSSADDILVEAADVIGAY